MDLKAGADLLWTRVPGLHDKAVGALDLHVVVEAALHQVNEVAGRHWRVVAVRHYLEQAPAHAVIPCLLQLDVHLDRGTALRTSVLNALASS